jgi:hypothetical protein
MKLFRIILFFAIGFLFFACLCNSPDSNKSSEKEEVIIQEAKEHTVKDNYWENLEQQLGFGFIFLEAPILGEQEEKIIEQFRQRVATSDFQGTNDCKEHNSFLVLKKLLIEILINTKGISSSIKRKMHIYLSKLIINGGAIDCSTKQRIVPGFILGQLGAASFEVFSKGVSIDKITQMEKIIKSGDNLEQLEELLAFVRPVLYGGEIDEKFDIDEDKFQKDEKEVQESIECCGCKSDFSKVVYFKIDQYDSLHEDLVKNTKNLDLIVREQGGRKSVEKAKPMPQILPVEALSVDSCKSKIFEKIQLLGMGPVWQDKEGRYLYWVNLADAVAKIIGDELVELFSHPESANRRKNRRRLVSYAFHTLSMNLGQGKDGTEHRSQDWLKNRLGEVEAQVFDKLRSDLAALFVCSSSQTKQDLEVLDSITRKAIIETYLGSTLELLAVGQTPETPEMIARMVTLNYLVEHGAIDIQEEGKGPMIFPVELARVNPAIGELLKEVRGTRFFGDPSRAGQIMEKYNYVKKDWLDFLTKSFAVLNKPSVYVPVFPVFQSHKEDSARILKPATYLDLFLIE